MCKFTNFLAESIFGYLSYAFIVSRHICHVTFQINTDIRNAHYAKDEHRHSWIFIFVTSSKYLKVITHSNVCKSFRENAIHFYNENGFRPSKSVKYLTI